MDSLPVMDRAYARRHELLAQDNVSWVKMMLDPHGVTLTICDRDGGKGVEFLPIESTSDDSTG